MQQQYSITSTGKAGDFFGGALLTDLMQLWNLCPSNEPAMLKTVGHFLLSTLPDEALTEALEGLAETYTYWKIRNQQLPESGKPVSKISNAVRGASYTRPIFRVTED